MKHPIQFTGLILSGVFLLVGCNWQSGTPPDDDVLMTGSITQSGKNTQKSTHTIEITSNGFTPSIVTVDKGDRVQFINRESSLHWPASARHPTHTTYPGSSIEKCSTSLQGSIFDACRGLGQGEEFSLVFDQVGEWGYHDHLNPELFGKIIVNEVQ